MTRDRHPFPNVGDEYNTHLGRGRLVAYNGTGTRYALRISTKILWLPADDCVWLARAPALLEDDAYTRLRRRVWDQLASTSAWAAGLPKPSELERLATTLQRFRDSTDSAMRQPGDDDHDNHLYTNTTSA
jgi:hypothetical protein